MIVVFTVNNRPEYLRRVLEAWSQVRGASSVTARFFCEPGCPEAVDLCTKADFFWNTQVVVHSQHAGVLVNPWIALSSAFTDRDFAILAEDDMIPATDVLELFDWAADRYEEDSEILAVCMGQAFPQPPADLAHVVRQAHFQGWIWGTWADRWDAIGPDWDKTYQYKGWDWRLNEHWIGEQGYRCIVPCLSRSQHIGQEGGVHCTPAMFESLLAQGFQQQVPSQGSYQLA